MVEITVTSRILVCSLKGTEGKKSFDFEMHNALTSSSLCCQGSCVRVSPQIAHHRQVWWITFPVFAKSICLQYPIQPQHPATCGAFVFYLIFISYYCHLAKLTLETKGYFVKSRLQLSRYESAVLILAQLWVTPWTIHSGEQNREPGRRVLVRALLPAWWLILDM